MFIHELIIAIGSGFQNELPLYNAMSTESMRREMFEYS